MLSFDLGQVNLAWVYLDWANKCLEFGMFCIDEEKLGGEVIDYRCSRIHTLMQGLREKYTVSKVIIERQVKQNQICQCIAFGIITLCREYQWEVYVFSPVLKFTYIQQPYTTVKRAHKKLSIENARRTIKEYFPDKYIEFMKYRKKDDLSDSFNQCWIYGLFTHIIEIDLDEYKKLVVDLGSEPSTLP
jgi:uncharacterized protein YlxP (DUF503 family)